MLNAKKEISSKSLTRDKQFSYLPDHDRYLLARETPEFRFNVIGTGINGQEHIRITYLEGNAVVHGIYDPNPRSIETACEVHRQVSPDNTPPPVVYESLEAACNDPDVDALIISTPNYTHLDVVKVAAQSGKHILLEKPISINAKDAVEITKIALEYPAVFQLGLQYRYKAMYSESIFEALKRETVGNIKMVSIAEHRVPFLDKVNQWNKFSRFSGNTLVEKCCHYFDLLNLFAQVKPVSVYASGHMDVNFTDFEYDGEKSDILDNAMVIVNYANGVRASFNLCMFSPMFSEELVVLGDAGRIRAVEHQDFVTDFDLESTLDILCGEDRPSRKMKPGYPAWIEQSGHNGATYYEHVNFVKNIRGEKTTTATAKEALWSVLVALAAQESIDTGQVVMIDDYLKAQDIELTEGMTYDE